jgi:acetone carboxylase gamma subunit
LPKAFPSRSDNEFVIRTDAGADLCRWDQNRKLHILMFLRETDALYPELGPPDGTWQELIMVESVPPFRLILGIQRGTGRWPLL